MSTGGARTREYTVQAMGIKPTDAAKFAARGSLVVCPLARISTLITDSAAPREALTMLSEAGVETVVVESLALNANSAA